MNKSSSFTLNWLIIKIDADVHIIYISWSYSPWYKIQSSFDKTYID